MESFSTTLYLMMEIKAYQAYRAPDLPLAYWRTSTGFEVDLILGDMATAVEVKGSSRVHEGDCRGLRALREEAKVKRTLIACLESHPRTLADGTEVCPWQVFLERLWGGDLDG